MLNKTKVHHFWIIQSSLPKLSSLKKNAGIKQNEMEKYHN